MQPTYHFQKRMTQRGITYDMCRFTIDNGYIEGDRFVTTRKMVRKMVDNLNAHMKRLIRLRKKFKHFGVSRLISKAINQLIAQKNIALKVIAKGGVVVVMDNNALITAYDVDSYKKY